MKSVCTTCLDTVNSKKTPKGCQQLEMCKATKIDTIKKKACRFGFKYAYQHQTQESECEAIVQQRRNMTFLKKWSVIWLTRA